GERERVPPRRDAPEAQNDQDHADQKVPHAMLCTATPAAISISKSSNHPNRRASFASHEYVNASEMAIEWALAWTNDLARDRARDLEFEKVDQYRKSRIAKTIRIAANK